MAQKKKRCREIGVVGSTRGMGGQPTSAARKENAYRTVLVFWETYGAGLKAEEKGDGTFKHSLVQRMGGLYEDLTGGRDTADIHRKILDILGEQRMYMMQFEDCLDEFNRYLSALSLLDAIMQHGI